MKELKQKRSYKQMLRVEKAKIPLSKKVRFSVARKAYLSPESGTYLNAKGSLLKAGYSESTASGLAPKLFAEGYRIPEFRVDPEDRQGVLDALNRWLQLMESWRISLSSRQPDEISIKEYSVISQYIERLAHIFGFIRENVVHNETTVVQINNMAVPEQYDKLKLMVQLLVQKIAEIEDKMSVPNDKRFSFN